MEDTYLPRLRASVGSQWDYVLKIAGIVARTPCFSIRRIAQPFEVARLIDLTESLIASL